MHREGVMTLVALEVAQDILQLIVALLIEVNDAPQTVGRKNSQLIAGLDVGFQIPATGLTPVVVIAPRIHKRVLGDGNTVDVRAEDHIAIEHQNGFANTVVMIRALHIVVAPKRKAHLSPGRKRLSELMTSNTEGLRLCAVVKHPFAHHRSSHQPMCLWRNGIIDIIVQEFVGVEHIPSLGIVNLEMEMRPSRVSRIAAQGDKLTL